MASSSDISYAAHTASCTFLLDGTGICRRIVMVAKGARRREGSRTATKCVGAQYVASLDGRAAGGLIEMPRVGAAMLFARVDERGRISLARTGLLLSFVTHAEEDWQSVETSAPELEHFDIGDPDQRIESLRPEDAELDEDIESAELETCEYPCFDPDIGVDPPTRRSLRASDVPPQAPPSFRDGGATNDNDARPPASARTLPHQRDGREPETTRPPSARSSDVHVARRRRGG